MSLASLNPEHLKRYKDIVGVLLRHGRSELLATGGLDRALLDEVEPAEQVEGDPERLARDLEELGPTFVKLGQLLSTRSDLLPRPYLEALSRLQDDLEPFSFETVEEIVEQELGSSLSAAFAEFRREPLAAASLGQVHRAWLHDGRPVAVKIQRPGVRRRILSDLDAFEEIAVLVDRHTDVGRRYAFRDMLEELRATLLRELDYRLEAESLERWAAGLAAHDRLRVPSPIAERTSSKVLTMEFIEGTKVTELDERRRSGIDCKPLAEALCVAYLEQMLLEGFFHADPHPGNVLLTDDGRLALVDLGMVARLTTGFRRNLIKLVLAVSQDDSAAVAELCAELGTRLKDSDTTRFDRKVAHLLGRFRDSTIEQLPLGRVVFELARISAEHSIRPAPELAVVGKTLLHLDEIGRSLDPQFDANAVLRSQVHKLATRHLVRGLTPGKAFSNLLEMNEFVQRLPRRVNKVLDALARRELELRVHAFDEAWMMGSLRKIGNRITVGLLIAALIVGASLIMRIETRYTILGYPALAMILFAIAVAGAFGLATIILLQDVWPGRK